MSYLPYEPQQQALLPQALQDWLPEGHLAYFVSDSIDSLDLQAFYARYEGGGSRNQPFHPAMMVKVLVYAYATGVFSSRKIARKLHEDVAFRVLAADNFPAHRTISDFRAFHLKELSELFVQVVRLAREMGLVKLGTIAVDGSKVKPRGPDGKPKPGGRYKQPFGVPKDKDQDNFTDPDSRIMQHAGGGFEASYNGQIAVDDTAHIIVAAELINNASDVRELPKMVEKVKAALGTYPGQTLADAGYRSEAVLGALEDHTELFVAIGREAKNHRPINAATLPLTAAMATKMATSEAREAYRRRKWLAEPPNGWIKNVLGFRQFSMRGLHRVQAEWKLVCMALNLRRMATLGGQ